MKKHEPKLCDQCQEKYLPTGNFQRVCQMCKTEYANSVYKRKPFYARWKDMRARCTNKTHPRYRDYGGRGIYICEEWQEFRTYQEWCLTTYEEGKSLDRVDNDGPYAPWNCRWATYSEQALNSRHDTPARILGREKGMRKSHIAIREKYGDYKTRTEKYCPDCGIKKGALRIL